MKTSIYSVRKHSNPIQEVGCSLEHSQSNPGTKDSPKDSEVSRGSVGVEELPIGTVVLNQDGVHQQRRLSHSLWAITHKGRGRINIG